MRNILPHRISHLHKSNGTSQDQTRIVSPARSSYSSSDKPLMLKIRVIQGRNLAPKDKSGTSDPYLVVHLGTQKQSTPSISRTLNPQWNQAFEMPITGVPLLECVCWDKDRFSKDYMGEFDIAIEEIFVQGGIQSEPQWYPLQSKRANSGKKSEVSGEIQMQFALTDSAKPDTTEDEIRQKFKAVVNIDTTEDDDAMSRTTSLANDEEDDVDSVHDTETGSTSDVTTVTQTEKKKKKKLAILRRKSIAARAYEFVGKDSDVAGMVFLEVEKVRNLPPERNMTRTGFDMDPFVVSALGRKVLRTKVIRHNLNPDYYEKMVYQVQKHEMGYSITFTIIDQDKLSGNDFVASAVLPLSKLVDAAPTPDSQTGLYKLPEPQEYSQPAPPPANKRFRLPLSRSSSQQNIKQQGDRPNLIKGLSTLSIHSNGQGSNGATNGLSTQATELGTIPQASSDFKSGPQGEESGINPDDPSMQSYVLLLDMKNAEKWEATHSPKLYLKAKYMPYGALRQQFWRAMLRQYDADESKSLTKIELTTMLDTLGSTLHESTINGFFSRFSNTDNDDSELALTFDQAVICLEDQLLKSNKKNSFSSKARHAMGMSSPSSILNGDRFVSDDPLPETDTRASANVDGTRSAVPSISVRDHGAAGEEGHVVNAGDDLADDSNNEEHVIEIRECPICHQPKLNKRTDADIITHIATCASADWRSVNNLVMGGFVTQSQAQRKWYSKVVNKVSYGGYKLGANSANILVQDRITGQINEERMSVYVRLGIRLLYKALGNREMEKKRIKKMLKSLSIKQGKKYDDPASAAQIENFVNFHKLNLDEVAQPLGSYKNFNEFFYRALKPGARPCSAPDRPEIVVSPSDCRTTVFNTIDQAQKIWVKGRDFTIEKLFGNAYPQDAKRYHGGSMGIFRLAPQDYHRFHVPVDGILGEPKPIEGEYYTVNPMAIRSALDVYGDNIRVVVPIDSVAHGRVMFVCIGAMMVGSTVITRKAGEHVKRAEELGYFKFGGSTVLLFFEPGQMVYDDDLVENSNGALETLIRVGMSIGHRPNTEPHRPDMKQDSAHITNEQRQEAKRRIEGSLAPETSTGGSGLDIAATAY